MDRGEKLVERARQLARRATRVTAHPFWSDVQRDTTPEGLEAIWSMYAAAALSASGKRLNSIQRLLAPALCDLTGAEILTRAAFEQTADLTYISKDIENRFPKYLSHGPFEVTTRPTFKIKLRKTDPFEGLPTNRWRQIKDICEDIGWDEDRRRLYRVTSVSVHQGSFVLMRHFHEALGIEASWEGKVVTLYDAIRMHIRLAELVAGMRPEAISREELERIDQSSLDVLVLAEGLLEATLYDQR